MKKQMVAMTLAFTLISPSFAGGEPEGKQGTQMQLLVQEALKKIALIPYSLVRSGVQLVFSRSYKSYSNEYIASLGLTESKMNELMEQGIFSNVSLSTSTVPTLEELLAGKATGASCDEVCPNSVEILNLVSERFAPAPERQLSFLNLDTDFQDSYEKQIGYCWGYTATLDDWAHLAVFDKTQSLGEIAPSESDERAFVQFYEAKIKRIMKKRKVTVIPGFESVRELSAHPLLKRYMKERVARRWAENAVRLESIINITMDGKLMSEKRTQKIIEQLTTRVMSKQTPRIIFAALGDATYSHVLNVYGMQKMADGSIRAYVWETNFQPEDVPMHSQFIEFRTDGTTHYAPLANSRIGHSQVGVVKLAFETDKGESQYIRQLVRFCREYSECKR